MGNAPEGPERSINEKMHNVTDETSHGGTYRELKLGHGGNKELMGNARCWESAKKREIAEHTNALGTHRKGVK